MSGERFRPSRHRERSPLLSLIAQAQGMKCAICGGALQFGGNPDSSLRVTYDHVLPRTLGGEHHSNRLAAHKACNVQKADRLPNGCESIMLAAVNAHLSRHFSPPCDSDTRPEDGDKGTLGSTCE